MRLSRRFSRWLRRRVPPPRSSGGRSVALLCLLLTPAVAQLDADLQTRPGRDLAELSLEELLNIEVTTVSRRPGAVSRSPAAIHVITNEDIQRSGATTLPEVLRLAPGVQVARVHAHQWGVSARGFNDVFANKLLVMIDGRSIYTPLFSGVFWDMHHTVLEDVERIEVIRGPGATLWGANAVNGIINIITRDSRHTVGTRVSAASGSHDRFLGSLRHGWKIGDQAYARVYFQHHDHDNFRTTDGKPAGDAWRFTQGGFRSDSDLSDVSRFTLQGDLFSGRLDERYRRLNPEDPYEAYIDEDEMKLRGGNLLARLTRSLENEADVNLQFYYDQARRETAVLVDDRQIFDVDLQHTLPVSDRHLVTWGGGYRVSRDDVENTFDVALTPDSRTVHLFNLFVQDEIELVEDTTNLTIGSKFEHNDFTGLEIQPGVRLSWSPRERQTVWAAVARAVRTPSRAEHDIRLNQEPVFPPGALGPGSPAMVTSLFGSEEFGSEKLVAYEVGYRAQPLEMVSFDLAAFYNDYDDLRSLEPANPPARFSPPPPHIAFFGDNRTEGESYGFELAANWQAADFWRLHGSYSHLRLNLRSDGPSGDPGTRENTEGRSPRHQWLLRSSLDLPHAWEWDTWFRFVDELPALQVESYLEMDMRLSWRPLPDFVLELVGRNLLDSGHVEFTPSFIQTQQAEIPRSFYGKVTWFF